MAALTPTDSPRSTKISFGPDDERVLTPEKTKGLRRLDGGARRAFKFSTEQSNSYRTTYQHMAHEQSLKDASCFACCREDRAATLTMVAILIIAIVGALSLISIVHPDMGSMTPFFTKVREIVTDVAHAIHTTPLNLSIFIVVIGGFGLISTTIWQAKLCCQRAQPLRHNSSPEETDRSSLEETSTSGSDGEGDPTDSTPRTPSNSLTLSQGAKTSALQPKGILRRSSESGPPEQKRQDLSQGGPPVPGQEGSASGKPLATVHFAEVPAEHGESPPAVAVPLQPSEGPSGGGTPAAEAHPQGAPEPHPAPASSGGGHGASPTHTATAQASVAPLAAGAAVAQEASPQPIAAAPALVTATPAEATPVAEPVATVQLTPPAVPAPPAGAGDSDNDSNATF